MKRGYVDQKGQGPPGSQTLLTSPLSREQAFERRKKETAVDLFIQPHRSSGCCKTVCIPPLIDVMRERGAAPLVDRVASKGPIRDKREEMSDAFVVLPQAHDHGELWCGVNTTGALHHTYVIERSSDTEPVVLRGYDLPSGERLSEVIALSEQGSWGTPCGINEDGVLISVHMVRTKGEAVRGGLSGYELARHALEQSTSALDALECIIEAIDRLDQSTRHGRRGTTSASFLIVGRAEAWAVETAGAHWVARRVRTFWAMSQCLTIEQDFDRISSNAYAHALKSGWCTSLRDFGFASALLHYAARRAQGSQGAKRGDGKKSSRPLDAPSTSLQRCASSPAMLLMTQSMASLTGSPLSPRDMEAWPMERADRLVDDRASCVRDREDMGDRGHRPHA